MPCPTPITYSERGKCVKLDCGRDKAIKTGIKLWEAEDKGELGEGRGKGI